MKRSVTAWSMTVALILALSACDRPGTPGGPSDRSTALLSEDTWFTLYLPQHSPAEDGLAPRFLGFRAQKVNLKGAYSWGNPDAPVQMVEFGDFQCPYCAQSHRNLHGNQRLLVQEGVLRVIFVDLPLPFHANAIPAAVAARCAAESAGPPGFWKMRDALYSAQDRWKDVSMPTAELMQLAKTTGVHGKKFDQCMQGTQERDEVVRLGLLAAGLGLAATPTYFFNGLWLSGMMEPAQFEHMVRLVRSQTAEEVLRGDSVPILP